LKWRGVWDAATPYAVDDAVSRGGSSWIAKIAHVNSAPAEGSANWDLVAKKGDTGATGLQGATGATGPQGPPGPQGPIGATGAMGAQGSAGPAGATGPQEPQGPAGSPGAFSLSGTSAFYTGGNVGIGTTNPQAELHVRTAGEGFPSKARPAETSTKPT
jgi:hypothetical protein